MAAVRQAKNWIAVASAEHARRGRDAAQGFMQVCRGKSAPLKRVQPGDCVVCYAPALVMGGKQPFQHFVSIGLVQAGSPLNPDFPLGAPAVLFGFQRRICGHFRPSSSPMAQAMGSSVGSKLTRNCIRCLSKP